MPMTRIEPYEPPHPTIRELIEGRPEGAEDGGIPPEGVPGEAAHVRLKEEGQGGGRLQREGTQSRRAAVRGRARDRQRGRGRVGRGEKRERRETRGRAPTWLGRGPPRGTPPVGEGTRDEHRSCDPMTTALMACPHAGRRVKKKQQGQEFTDRPHRGKGGRGGPKKKRKKTPQCTVEGTQHRTSRLREEG